MPLPLPQMADEATRLAAALVMGVLVTLVQRWSRADRTANPALGQAQVLLCLSGALMMMVIDNSLARAFGVAGAASIVRFRTPVDDPRDATVLFLLMGLGMAAGLGMYEVAGLGTVVLSGSLVALARFGERADRCMKVEIVADGRVFPTEHVQRVCALNAIALEPIELRLGQDATARFRAHLPPGASIDTVNTQLMADVPGSIRSVTWEAQKKSA
jgi:hypothetical protein